MICRMNASDSQINREIKVIITDTYPYYCLKNKPLLNSIFIMFHCLKNKLLLLGFLCLNACEGLLHLPFETKISDQKIKIGYLHAPSPRVLTFASLEKDLTFHFAQDMNLQLEWVPFKSATDLMADLKQGRLQIGMGRLNTNWSLETQGLLLGPVVEETSLKQICPAFAAGTNSASANYILKKDGTPATLKALHAKIANIRVMDQISSAELFKKAFRNNSSCVILEKRQADSFVVDFKVTQKNQTVLDSIPVGFLISGKNPELQKAFQFWFQKYLRHQRLIQLKELHFDFSRNLDPFERLAFYKKTSEDLKKLKPSFLKMETEFQLPWQLIAAVSYQESHWDENAVSPTGVLGFMMLTRQTANFLGIKDRSSLEQSLWGGSKYLQQLIREQPRFLTSRNQLVLALTSYNIGRGHLQDAQKLAIKKGVSPYSWKDLQEILPLLSQAAYFEDLQYGQARGREPIAFVKRVMGYYELLINQI